MKLNNDWCEVLKDCVSSGEYKSLCEKVEAEYQNGTVYPPRELVFAAFNLCSFDNVKVVILGQDPYFNPNQAVGLAFSVEIFGTKIKTVFPPSLKNIIKEVRAELGSCAVEDGDLRPWARQGVLLLNTSLTVRQGKPLSHSEIGWDCVVNSTITALNQKDNIVFLLWGSHARKYKKFLSNPRNLILESSHPSPLSAHNGFFGCGHFKQTNEFLTNNCKRPIMF